VKRDNVASSGSWAFALTWLFFSWCLHLAMVIAFSSGWWLCGFFISGLSMFLEEHIYPVQIPASVFYEEFAPKIDQGNLRHYRNST
jgi:hypothetical protein